MPAILSYFDYIIIVTCIKPYKLQNAKTHQATLNKKPNVNFHFTNRYRFSWI